MVRLRTHPGEPRPRNCKVIRRQENFRPATCRFMCRRLRLFSLFPRSMVVKFSDSKLKREAVSYLSRPAIRHCWASAKAALNLIVAAQPTAWGADKAHIAWKHTEDVFLYRGSSAPKAGRCLFISPSERSISLDLKVHSGRPMPVPPSTSSLSAHLIPQSSWRSTPGSPVTPKFRRCGVSDTSNRIARWPAAKKFSPRPEHFATKSFPAMH